MAQQIKKQRTRQSLKTPGLFEYPEEKRSESLHEAALMRSLTCHSIIKRKSPSFDNAQIIDSSVNEKKQCVKDKFVSFFDDDNDTHQTGSNTTNVREKPSEIAVLLNASKELPSHMVSTPKRATSAKRLKQKRKFPVPQKKNVPVCSPITSYFKVIPSSKDFVVQTPTRSYSGRKKSKLNDTHVTSDSKTGPLSPIAAHMLSPTMDTISKNFSAMRCGSDKLNKPKVLDESMEYVSKDKQSVGSDQERDELSSNDDSGNDTSNEDLSLLALSPIRGSQWPTSFDGSYSCFDTTFDCDGDMEELVSSAMNEKEKRGSKRTCSNNFEPEPKQKKLSLIEQICADLDDIEKEELYVE